MEANNYLDEVVAQQARVEGELRAKRSVSLAMPAPSRGRGGAIVFENEEPTAPGASGGQAVGYRITGWFRRHMMF